MTRSSHNLARVAVPEFLPRSQNFDLGKKRVTLQILQLVDRKLLAAKLNVSESMISKWVVGEKGIPVERMFEIACAGKAFCMEVQSVENEIDLMMLLQFGRKDL